MALFARDIRLTQTGIQPPCAEGTHRSSISKRAGNTSTQASQLVDHKSAAEEVAIAAGQMLHADYVESGTYPIIMANEFGGVIFHEACGHLLETTQIERKTSPLREKEKNCPRKSDSLG